jgi:transcriptional pleiotropic regulator of transition state genes
MKSTGIVRKVDDLGRIVIPKELRKTMNIKKKDPMEIFVEKINIILSKYEKGCLFCEKWEILLSLKELLFARNA